MLLAEMPFSSVTEVLAISNNWYTTWLGYCKACGQQHQQPGQAFGTQIAVESSNLSAKDIVRPFGRHCSVINAIIWQYASAAQLQRWCTVVRVVQLVSKF